VWYPDNLAAIVQDKDLASITSFKSVRLVEATTASECRDFVGARLLVNEDVNGYRLYAIKEQGNISPGL
jgi:hypothetical protein